VIGALRLDFQSVSLELTAFAHYQLSMDDHLLSLIVPAFNEERTIEAVLDKVLHFLPNVHEVLVAPTLFEISG
jgi:hypothetical protein